MPQTVLIVDDSMPLHTLIKAHLEPDNLKIHSVHDGESCLAAAIDLKPALILLDVDIPRLDGFEVCRRLKANPATANIPIIFLTANPMVADKVKGLELGACDYITKPFKSLEFRARVRAALRSKHHFDAVTMVDGLTGLWNRAYLDLHLNSHFSLARRSGSPLACVVVKLDQRNTLVAEHGEEVAEQVVRSVARVLLSQCRAEDIVCRYSAWRFVILVSGANRAAGGLLAERLRTGIEQQSGIYAGIQTNITCSFGVSDSIIADEKHLLDRANSALKREPQLGSNRVMIARETDDELNAAA
ncbi:MAG: response regulator [Planctomycetota bacterium]|nr:response regulator [Planctomycetota bacterium]